MQHEFLSPAWIRAAQAVWAEHQEMLPAPPTAPLRLNLEITGAPDSVAADGTVHAHAETGGPALTVDTGTLAEPDLTLTLDYDTAYDLLVQQRPNAALGAFLTGRIRVAGDLTRVAEQAGVDAAALPSLLASLGITGTSTLADVDPAAGRLGERIRDLTR